MLLGGYIKLARSSMRSSRWRSVLTMLGIIVGIVSVVTTVSIGEGVKQQIVNQIERRGEDLITILPGKTDADSASGYFARLNPTAPRVSSAFGESDLQALRATPGVSRLAPFGTVTGEVAAGSESFAATQVIATSEDLPNVLNQKLAFGTFFTDKAEGSVNSAVIGQRVAEELFGENVPLGRELTVRGTKFIVRGVFEEFDANSPLLAVDNYDNAIFIPYRVGQELMGGSMAIYQVLARPSESQNTSILITALHNALAAARGDATDYAVLKQSDALELTDGTLALLTTMIAGVASISLVVGGIGIMNIMLVSVTERTREIGVRKAVGATNRQILYQFLTEAAVLSFVGGVLGVLMSLGVNFVLRIMTNLEPVVSLASVLVAVGVSFAVGVLFGSAPAVVASRKDPIDSLRYQ